MRKKQKKFLTQIITILIVLLIAFVIKEYQNKKQVSQIPAGSGSIPSEIISSLAAPNQKDATSDNTYKTLNNNTPYFNKDDLTTKSWEEYGELDKLGRVTTANANVGVDIMPTEKREEINQVKPSGWQSNKTAHVYDRAHLVGFQLAGENANPKNLMTGTRFMNLNMIPFENKIADYVKKTKNHVRYRVTPVFKNNDLVAQGVIMEAMSVEDNGAGVKFNIFCYNFQKNVEIDYATGKYTLLK